MFKLPLRVASGCFAWAMLAVPAVAADLTWVNWSGDLKASTAANWSPAQVPQEGDNLYISYDGQTTKYWHNDLDVVYGHITVALTNASTRVDFDQKEVRVSDGISILGDGSATFYPRTAITGSGEFEIDIPGGSVYLPTSPTSGRTYTGDVMIRRGTFSPQAADVLGTEQQHGKITICAPTTKDNQYGKLTPSGTWTMWNEIYYDNTSSAFAFHPSGSVTYRGAWYFTGGGGTVQMSGVNAIHQYGGIYKWTPEGRATRTDCVHLFCVKPGIVLHGGYTDETCVMSVWGNDNTLVVVDSDLDLPLGVRFRGAGQVRFTKDLTTTVGLPFEIAGGSPVIDLCGTTQRLGSFTMAAAAVAPMVTNSSETAAKVIWMPTADETFGPILAGKTSLTLEAADITGTLASSKMDGGLAVAAGTLEIPSTAVLPNVRSWDVADGATLRIGSSDLNENAVLRLADGATLDVSEGVVFKVLKAFVNDTRLDPGDYQYGDGTLRVADPIYTWTGAAGDGNLSNPENWNYKEVPTAEDNVLLSTGVALSLSGSLEANTLTLGSEQELALANGALIKANQFIFNSGVSIACVDGSATLEFAAEGTYETLPTLKNVRVKSSGGVVTILSDTWGDGKLNLETSDDGDFAVGAGRSLPVYTFKRGDTYVDPGEVVAGSGKLVVYTRPAVPAETWEVWTGLGGEADQSIFSHANWEGGEAPNLATGDAKLRFPADAVVEIPSSVARVHQIEFQGAATLFGEGKLMIGAGGVQQAEADVDVSVDVEFSAVPMEWAVDGSAATLKFHGAFGAHAALPADGKVSFVGNGTKVKSGMANVYFYGERAETLNAEVVVSNLLANINNGKAFSRERGLSIWSKGYDFTFWDAHLFALKLVVEFPVRFYGHQKELTRTTSPTDNILTFNEPVYFYIDKDVDASTAANITCRNTYIFNAPVYLDGTLSLYNGEVPRSVAADSKTTGTFFNDTLTIAGSGHRLYLSGAGGFVHFSKPGSDFADVYGFNGSRINASCHDEDVFDTTQSLLFYSVNNVVHLNGFDQHIKSLWCNSSAGVNCIISNAVEEGKAVLHLTNASANNNLRAQWGGSAGADFNVGANKSLDFREGVTVTRGPLIVTSGTLNFKDTAQWHGTGEVRIASGATLTTSAVETFGNETDGYGTKLRVAAGGVLKLGANEVVRNLMYGDDGLPMGEYGAIGSGAQYEVDWLAGSTGKLTVLKNPPTGVLFLVK